MSRKIVPDRVKQPRKTLFNTIVIWKENKLSFTETKGRLEDFEHWGELMEQTLGSLVRVIRLSVC